MSRALSLWFEGPGQISLREGGIPTPGADQVLVRSLRSGISAGTEMLVYRGQFPESLPVDATIESMAMGFAYPLKYGYAAVGKVIEVGSAVDPTWLGRRVFAFNPHESHFAVSPKALLPLPEGISNDDGVFIPNLETALTLLHDGTPLIGEKVIVLGQGIVGLLVTHLLASMRLAQLITVDRYDRRREAALMLGALRSFSPDDPKLAELRDLDLSYELSGAPAALNAAIRLTGYSGRVVVGSFYGNKRADLELGGWFHRSRMQIISSQVSTIQPALRGRWDSARRLQTVLSLLTSTQPQRLISHRFPISRAPEAYRLLAEQPEQALQVVLDYAETQ
ncbi:MAG: zinc-binding alcohol dehydrogenase [Chloroflexi bacterium]|nr:zinc-binding alcohol dehydrogenase [Chloroflexota bacterium]